MRASILIVNWNGREHLATCLDSLQGQTFRDFEVILVDNGSTDDSVPFLKENYSWVKLVALEENTGFATGNNVGLENASGEHLITLNNDTRVAEKWLEELVAAADADPEVGMVACRICSFDDPDRIDSLGIRIAPDGMARGAGRLRKYSEMSLQDGEEVLIPSACAALYKRRMIEEIGFFDDDFFAYCEDTDLGLRGRFAGWKAVLATEAVVYHKYSGTGGTFSPFKLYLVERNHFWVALKNFPLPHLLLLPFHTLHRYLEQARMVLSGKGSGRDFMEASSKKEAAAALLKGILDALRGAPGMLKKRREIRMQINKKLSSAEVAALLRRYRLSFRELLDDF